MKYKKSQQYLVSTADLFSIFTAGVSACMAAITAYGASFMGVWWLYEAILLAFISCLCILQINPDKVEVHIPDTKFDYTIIKKTGIEE
jgi:hypothetical protein